MPSAWRVQPLLQRSGKFYKDEKHRKLYTHVWNVLWLFEVINLLSYSSPRKMKWLKSSLHLWSSTHSPRTSHTTMEQDITPREVPPYAPSSLHHAPLWSQDTLHGTIPDCQTQDTQARLMEDYLLNTQTTDTLSHHRDRPANPYNSLYQEWVHLCSSPFFFFFNKDPWWPRKVWGLVSSTIKSKKKSSKTQSFEMAPLLFLTELFYPVTACSSKTGFNVTLPSSPAPPHRPEHPSEWKHARNSWSRFPVLPAGSCCRPEGNL